MKSNLANLRNNSTGVDSESSKDSDSDHDNTSDTGSEDEATPEVEEERLDKIDELL